MRNYVYRNFTVEHLFTGMNADFSGYNEVKPVTEAYDRIIWFYELDPVLAEPQIKDELNYQLKLVKNLFDNDDIESNVVLLVPEIRNNVTLIGNNNSNFSLSKLIEEYRDISKRRKNIDVIFISDFYNRYKVSLDWKYFYTARMIVPPSMSGKFNRWFLLKMSSLELNRKKCIVLDCDNTLWGGVIGEDGLTGIDLGQSTKGKVYSDFQRFVKLLFESGVIITLCSKNNEQDVWEVFEKHPEMVLTREMITAFEINWNNKADNILSIQKKLNIGLDAMVFVDDSPFERNLVAEFLPEVSVVEFPTNIWSIYGDLRVDLADLFAIKTLTNEDLLKTKQYRQRAERENYRSSFDDLNDYIGSLRIRMKISPVDDFSISRASQMTQKTNQFNLTTKRYTETDLIRLMNNGYEIFTLSVDDRFGDSGITGLIIFKTNKDFHNISVELDSYLLSCRVLGRGIENEFLKTILNSFYEKGIRVIKASFIKSKKNQLVTTFFEENGFSLLSQQRNRKDYEIILNDKLINDIRYEVEYD